METSDLIKSLKHFEGWSAYYGQVKIQVEDKFYDVDCVTANNNEEIIIRTKPEKQ